MMIGKMTADIRPPGKPRDGRHCDLCGSSQPAVRCDKCGSQTFCLSCDDMYHRHPKRRFHLRKAVDPPPPSAATARPAIPLKAAALSPGDPSKMPLPPPRRKKPKSFFDSFRRRSPSGENSPPLPKKEYSWTDRFGNIKKFMSNRPLPPLPNGEEEDDHVQTNGQTDKRDLAFIHRRVDEKPPQLPQRCSKPQEFLVDRSLENSLGSQNPAVLRNGNGNSAHAHSNSGFHENESNQWNNSAMERQKQLNTLNRQMQPPFMHPGGPGYPGSMHQSASATDLHSLPGLQNFPPGMPPGYPHYPLPPHYPYPVYPGQYPGYPGYYGDSFANLASRQTTDGDQSDHSEASSRHHGNRSQFRKRAKRSQSVLMDRMAFPGQYYPFGPFPPGYGPGPWGVPPFPPEDTPSRSSSMRSLHRVGRATRRSHKKTTSEDEDEEFSMSSSPLSRNKSSSSERPQPTRRTLPSSSSESDEEEDRKGSARAIRRNSGSNRLTSPAARSPQLSKKPLSKPKKETTASRRPEVEEVKPAAVSNERKPSFESDKVPVDPPEDAPPWTPTTTWHCQHCTFVNKPSNRICQVCCKTATLPTEPNAGTRLNIPTPDNRKQSVSSEESVPAPEKVAEDEEEKKTKREKQDMAVLNSALDAAEKEISRGLEELMKLKEDLSSDSQSSNPQSQPTTKPTAQPPTKPAAQEPLPEKPKPIYKSSGKMRPLNRTTSSPKPTTKSSSTETQTTSTPSWRGEGRVVEARRPSTSSVASDEFNSPMAQSPQPESNLNRGRQDSSCQTLHDGLIEYLERKKEEAYFARPNAGYGLRYGERLEAVTSPVPMYERDVGFRRPMQRSHSRASLFNARLNEGPRDYVYSPTPMYRSVSRSSLAGDFGEPRLSEFHNLRKPDYYLSMEELVERRRQESIKAQGLELVRMIREAEQQGFTADDIQVALHNCGKQSPMAWLQDNWRHMVENVINLSTSYGSDKQENDIGVVSESEARDALRMQKGNIWAAVTECVENRQRKFLELKVRGKFSRQDITEALTSCQGDVEMAFAKLAKSTSKPFLMRIWGAGEGAQNQDGASPLATDPQGFANRFTKMDNEDDLWDDDEEVEWEDDSDEEQDLDDLQTCREDLGVTSNVTSPESDRSDYCDAFASKSNTLDRGVAAPSSDEVTYTVPEVKQEKKGKGLLSKLAALRRDDRKKDERKFYSSNSDLSACSDENLKGNAEQAASNQTKNTGPFSMIKNTISAIRETVSSSSKVEKKACTVPERRTIIVAGNVTDETVYEDKSAVAKLKSIKPLNDEVKVFDSPYGIISTEFQTPKDVKTLAVSSNVVATESKESYTPNNKTCSVSELETQLKTNDKKSDNLKLELNIKSNAPLTKIILESKASNEETSLKSKELSTQREQETITKPKGTTEKLSPNNNRTSNTKDMKSINDTENIKNPTKSTVVKKDLELGDSVNDKSISNAEKRLKFFDKIDEIQTKDVCTAESPRESNKKNGSADDIQRDLENLDFAPLEAPPVNSKTESKTLDPCSSPKSNKILKIVRQSNTVHKGSANTQGKNEEKNENDPVRSQKVQNTSKFTDDFSNITVTETNNEKVSEIESQIKQMTKKKIELSSETQISESKKMINQSAVAQTNIKIDVMETNEASPEPTTNFRKPNQQSDLKSEISPRTGNSGNSELGSIGQKNKIENTIQSVEFHRTSPIEESSLLEPIINNLSTHEIKNITPQSSVSDLENPLNITNQNQSVITPTLKTEEILPNVHDTNPRVAKIGAAPETGEENRSNKDKTVSLEKTELDNQINIKPIPTNIVVPCSSKSASNQEVIGNVSEDTPALELKPVQVKIFEKAPKDNTIKSKNNQLDKDSKVPKVKKVVVTTPDLTIKEKTKTQVTYNNTSEAETTTNSKVSLLPEESQNVHGNSLQSPPVENLILPSTDDLAPQTLQTNLKTPTEAGSSSENSTAAPPTVGEETETATKPLTPQPTSDPQTKPPQSSNTSSQPDLNTNEPPFPVTSYPSSQPDSKTNEDHSNASSPISAVPQDPVIIPDDPEEISVAQTPILPPEVAPATDEPLTITEIPEDDMASPDGSRRNSSTPPSPVEGLRNRFEGLVDRNAGSVLGPIRPQSPYTRRMSFRSIKSSVALERNRDSSTEKPWFLQKTVTEPVKPLPKRSIKQQMEMERKVRKMVSDRKCRTYKKAEVVVQLMEMRFSEEESLQAANECSSLEKALSYLQQECLLCVGHFPVSQIIPMVHCAHKACRECIRAYFTVQIRDRNIMELLCPFCNEPDIYDEDVAQDYFNHLDIMLKKLVDFDIHELFQRKLRDRVLMRDPNFRWCSQCSSGFLTDGNLTRLVCPDCNAVTCANCRRPWERDHQGLSCEEFAALRGSADPEVLAAGLAKQLTEDGIDCPRCHFRYALAKGGCMHFRCIQCQHDFCSGCSRPFKMGQKCGVSEFCAKLGLHAHHPRNCLFYLRDKEPQDLQRLLDLSDVAFDVDVPCDVTTTSTCQVMEQKETADGMRDDHCGKDVEEGFAGLCRIHYVEYLGQLVNKNKVDPIQIFENDDLELVLRRANIRLPPKRYRETDDQYRDKLVELIHEELPLDKMDGS